MRKKDAQPSTEHRVHIQCKNFCTFDVNINTMAKHKIDTLIASICDEWKVKVLVDA